MQTLINPSLALQLILETVQPLEMETIVHGAALGRTLAADVLSPLQLPPFDNSAMDGYALCSEDLRDASKVSPTRLQQLETIGAGDVPERAISCGFCSKIMTGAPLPLGADAVVMREESRQSDSEDGIVEILTSAQPGENIRRAGSDVRRGELVLQAGTKIGAAQWAMLASLGVAKVEVFRRPRVGIIATGDELAGIDEPLRAGQIRDSNSFALRALAENCGAEVASVRSSSDARAEFESILREVAQSCDVVITSGGVSVGDFDVVRDVLQDVAEVIFWKIAMKPGKPVMFARFGGKPIFGLPGNPVSVMVAFEEFARPAILKLSGRRDLHKPLIPVRLNNDLHSPRGKVDFVRACVRLKNGQWQASSASDQGSGRLSTMTNANSLLIIDADCTHVASGDMVLARLIDYPEID